MNYTLSREENPYHSEGNGKIISSQKLHIQYNQEDLNIGKRGLRIINYI